MAVLPIVKTVVSAVVSVGAGAVVGNALKIGTPTGLHVLKRAAIAVGSFALASMIGDKTAQYAEDSIDEVVDIYKTATNPESSEED